MRGLILVLAGDKLHFAAWLIPKAPAGLSEIGSSVPYLRGCSKVTALLTWTLSVGVFLLVDAQPFLRKLGGFQRP